MKLEGLELEWTNDDIYEGSNIVFFLAIGSNSLLILIGVECLHNISIVYVDSWSWEMFVLYNLIRLAMLCRIIWFSLCYMGLLGLAFADSFITQEEKA